jgi:carboxyl-terminal processing protease
MMNGTKVGLVLAVLLAAAWGGRGQEAAPEGAVAAVAEAAAPMVAEEALTPEAAGAEGVREALGAMPGWMREGLDAEAVRRAAMDGVLKAGDPGAAILDGEGDAGEEWYAGLLLTGSKDGPRVSSVAPESPASAAGVQAGDRLAEAGGEAAGEGYDLTAVRAALRCGAEAGLAVKALPADGGEVREVVLERRKRAESPALSAAERLPTGIGYLRLECVRDGVAEEIAQALAAWEEEEQIPAGLVLDLRGADGGAEAEGEIVGIAARFALPGKILYRVDEGTAEARTVAVGAFPGERVKQPLMVLVDEGTTGAAELLAAALAAGAEGAMAVGRPTAGNPLVREVRELPDGRWVRLAVHSVETADGRRYDGRAGLAPALEIGARALDESVYEPEEPVLRKGKSLSEEEKEDRALRDRTRFDPYLRRAADVLLGLQALGHEWR